MRQAFALIVSIALGLLAVFAMKNYINQEKKAATRQEDMVLVVFSTRPLQAKKSPIEKSDLEIKSLPSSAVSPDMVKPHELVEIVGKTIEREVNRGGPIFHSDFLGARREQMSDISTGRRLVSVSVNQVSGVSGLIRPGQRVDILYTQAQSAEGKVGQGGSSTSLMLENITVHAIDSQTLDLPNSSDKRGKSYSTLTLSVTPMEAGLLTSASHSGTLTFLIRSKEDFERGVFPTAITSASLEQVARDANGERWKASIKDSK